MQAVLSVFSKCVCFSSILFALLTPSSPLSCAMLPLLPVIRSRSDRRADRPAQGQVFEAARTSRLGSLPSSPEFVILLTLLNGSLNPLYHHGRRGRPVSNLETSVSEKSRWNGDVLVSSPRSSSR